LKKNKDLTPSKYDLKKIATQILVSELRLVTGMSLIKLEKHFKKMPGQSDDQFRALHLRSFCKYADGTRSIRDKALIQKIEAQHPGMTRILNHPLWFILNNPTCGKKAIHKNMQSLDEEVRSIVCIKRAKAGIYPRRAYTNARSMYRIVMKNDLDALACILMLIREMEIERSMNSANHARWLAHWLFFRLAHFEPFKTVIADKLYKITHSLFFIDIYSDRLKFSDTIPWLPYTYLPPPPFENDRDKIDNQLSDILSNAEHYSLNLDDMDSQLRFLFWCSTLGIDKISEALQLKVLTPQSKALIEKLISAYIDSELKLHLPRKCFDGLSRSFYRIDSTIDSEELIELLGIT